MYGLLLLNLEEYVVKTFGKEKWKEIKVAMKIKDQETFNPEDTFPESQLVKMGKKAIQLTQMKDEEFYEVLQESLIFLSLYTYFFRQWEYISLS